MQQELVAASSRHRAGSFNTGPGEFGRAGRPCWTPDGLASPFVLFSTRYQLLSVVAVLMIYPSPDGRWDVKLNFMSWEECGGVIEQRGRSLLKPVSNTMSSSNNRSKQTNKDDLMDSFGR